MCEHVYPKQTLYPLNPVLTVDVRCVCLLNCWMKGSWKVGKKNFVHVVHAGK